MGTLRKTYTRATDRRERRMIYGTEDVHELVKRIRRSNWIKPLVVTPDNRIVSGHRRWYAAQQLAMATVPVERRSFASDEDELEALLLENENRDKTVEQKVREAACWQEVEAEKAKRRQIATLKQNQPAEQAAVPPSLAERNGQGEAREKAAEKVGMKRSSYDKAVQVVRTADTLTAQGKTTEAQTLLRVLNEQSVDAAAKIVREDEPVRDAALQKIATGESRNVKEAKRAIQVEQYAALAAQVAATPGGRQCNSGSAKLAFTLDEKEDGSPPEKSHVPFAGLRAGFLTWT